MFTASPEFIAFLRAAKLASYAAQGEAASVRPLLSDTRQLEHSQGPYLYRDVYVGMLRFVGQEIVYFDKRPAWSMAYGGGLADGVAQSEAARIYRVLRGALSATPAELPLRGPHAFEAEELRYTCSISGDLKRFQGQESISGQGHVQYELQFTGGVLI